MTSLMHLDEARWRHWRRSANCQASRVCAPTLRIFILGELGEYVAQVGEGVDAAATAAFDDRVEDRAAVPAPTSPKSSPFFVPMAVGRMPISPRVLSISRRLSRAEFAVME